MPASADKTGLRTSTTGDERLTDVARLMRCPCRGVGLTDFIFMRLTKVFKTDFMSINPPDLHQGQQGRQGRDFTGTESVAQTD